MNRVRDFRPFAGRFGAAPRRTTRSISPGFDLIEASPAAARQNFRRQPTPSSRREIADNEQLQVHSFKRSTEEILLPRPFETAKTSEVDGEYLKSSRCEHRSLTFDCGERGNCSVCRFIRDSRDTSNRCQPQISGDLETETIFLHRQWCGKLFGPADRPKRINPTGFVDLRKHLDGTFYASGFRL